MGTPSATRGRKVSTTGKAARGPSRDPGSIPGCSTMIDLHTGRGMGSTERPVWGFSPTGPACRVGRPGDTGCPPRVTVSDDNDTQGRTVRRTEGQFSDRDMRPATSRYTLTEQDGSADPYFNRVTNTTSGNNSTGSAEMILSDNALQPGGQTGQEPAPG